MINIVFTGGTIGSRYTQNGTVDACSEAPYKLLEQTKINDREALKISEPYCILSENLDAEHIMMLVSHVSDILENDKPEGIIITHGTDTLQYTAAFLDMCFSNAGIPILLVSSNYILTDERANGYDNFACALDYIHKKKASGVYVCYRNSDGKMHIISGKNMQSPKSYNSDMEEAETDCDKSCAVSPKDFFLSSPCKVLRVAACPGNIYPDIKAGVKAILLESFHSGTIGISPELKELLSEAKSREIPVYITGVSSSAAEYESISEYKKLGIIPIVDEAPIHAYCRLWVLTSQLSPKE